MARKSYFYGLLLVLLLSAVLAASCASQEQGTQPNQSSLTEEEFKNLLTVQDVQQVLVSQVELNTRFLQLQRDGRINRPATSYCHG